jgi:putative FmdB family regulatory protein
MPLYVFECQFEGCGVRFERNLKMGDYRTHECPGCHEPAPRVIEGFAFGFKEPEGASQGNTGVHKDDYPTADHIVGKDAEKSWAQYHEREKVKNQVRVGGKTHALMRRTDKGGDFVEYEAMSDGGLANRKARAKKAFAALEAAKAAR